MKRTFYIAFGIFLAFSIVAFYFDSIGLKTSSHFVFSLGLMSLSVMSFAIGHMEGEAKAKDQDANAL